jgi:hypothetical protein
VRGKRKELFQRFHLLPASILGRLFSAGKWTEEKDEEARVVNWESTALEVCELNRTDQYTA